MVERKRAGRETAGLGEGLRQLRLERGWTQQELAERVGVQQKQISSYERGANTPSSQTFIALAKALGVSLDRLAQLSPLDSAQAAIADIELFEKMRQVDRLSDEDRALVKDVMDLVVFRRRAGELSVLGGAVPAREDGVPLLRRSAAEERDPIKRIGQGMGWGERRLRKEVRATRSDVRHIVRLDQKTRLQTIRGANSRYLGPLFGALLLEEARRRIPAEPAEALALAEAALASSSRRTRRHEPDPEVQAAALAVGGNAKRALGRLREGEADLEKARELLHDPGLRDPALPAEVHSYLGSLRKDQGRFAEAVRHLRFAGILFDVLEEPEKAARVLLTLGLVHYVGLDFEAAVAATEEALELLPPDAESWLRAYAHYNLAHHLHARGDIDRAEAELAAHAELLAAAGEEVVQHVVWLRARIAWSRDDVKTAERLYTEARERAMERGIAFDTSQVSLELALVHLVQGRTARVKKLALEALDVFAEQEVEREIHTALALLEAAARRDAITQELLQRTIDTLERARHGRRAPGGLAS